jgi:uncharacterized protein
MQPDATGILRRMGGWVIALVIVAVVIIAALSTGQDPATLMSIFSTRFLGIFIEAVPFLLLGTLVSGLIEAFVSADDIARWTPRNPVLATVAGTFMGMAFPVCECGVVPVVRRLYNKGLPMSVGVTFLLAAPVMNPVVLASTYIAFGFGPILIGRFVITAIVAVAVGLVFAFAARPQEVLQPQSLMPVMGGSGEVIPLYAKTKRPSLLAGLRHALDMAGNEFFEMGRYLIIGSMVAAVLQTFQQYATLSVGGVTISVQEALLTLGASPTLSVIAMQALAFILSVCSTVDAFLALAFVGTFTTGSLLAFLTFGPMVDIKSTLMFMGVYKRRTVLYLIALPLLMTMLIGIWVNLNIPL